MEDIRRATEERAESAAAVAEARTGSGGYSEGRADAQRARAAAAAAAAVRAERRKRGGVGSPARESTQKAPSQDVLRMDGVRMLRHRAIADATDRWVCAAAHCCSHYSCRVSFLLVRKLTLQTVLFFSPP